MAYVDIFNTDKKYEVIYADPPWDFKTYSKVNQDRAAENHYNIMNLDDIKKLPVAKLADKRCALFMWTTDTHLEQSFEVIKAWGFKYVTVGFYWAKLNKNVDRTKSNLDKDMSFGMGYYTRANPEPCLAGSNDAEMSMCLLSRVAKAPERNNKGVRKLIFDERREHSRKPDSVHEKIEALFGKDTKKIELFARTEVEGWDCCGNEVNKF